MNKGIIFATSNVMAPRVVGAYRIATFARQHGWDVEVVDYLAHWKLEELKQLARTRITDDVKFLGFSFLFIDAVANVVELFLEWIKEEYPHLVIIAGSGTMTNYIPLEDHVDYNIRGFGEHAFVALLKYLFSNGPCPAFTLSSLKVKTIDANTFYPAFPMPDLTVDYEDRDFIGPYEWLMVESTRGCRFSCAYCTFPILGVKDDYTRSSQNLRDQLQTTYDKYGVSNYAFSDDTFNDSTEKVTRYADALEDLPFRPRFSAYIRPDLLIRRPHEREELLRLNVIGHFYGIETMNPRTGKAVGKGLMGDDLKDGLLSVKKFFETHAEYYRTTMSIIYGLPYETIDTIRSAEKWYVENWQRQQVLAYPLRINTLDAGVKSKMSLDYAKYGYREIDPNIVEDMAMEYALKYPQCADIFFETVNISTPQQHMGTYAETRDTIIWENDDMNVLDAAVATKQWKHTKLRHDFRRGVFELGYLSREDTMAQRLGPDAKGTEGLIYIRACEIVDEYKQNKINWTPPAAV